MFQLEDFEKNEPVTICDRFKTLKDSFINPYAFTAVESYGNITYTNRRVLDILC